MIFRFHGLGIHTQGRGSQMTWDGDILIITVCGQGHLPMLKLIVASGEGRNSNGDNLWVMITFGDDNPLDSQYIYGIILNELKQFLQHESG